MGNQRNKDYLLTYLLKISSTKNSTKKTRLDWTVGVSARTDGRIGSEASRTDEYSEVDPGWQV